MTEDMKIIGLYIHRAFTIISLIFLAPARGANIVAKWFMNKTIIPKIIATTIIVLLFIGSIMLFTPILGIAVAAFLGWIVYAFFFTVHYYIFTGLYNATRKASNKYLDLKDELYKLRSNTNKEKAGGSQRNERSFMDSEARRIEKLYYDEPARGWMHVQIYMNLPNNYIKF